MGVHTGATTAAGIKAYSRKELEAFNLCETPIYVFDMERKGMWWGNAAACELWNAENLQALMTRNFNDDMSDTIRQRIDEQLIRIVDGEIIYEQWTFYPSGREPITVSQSVKAIRIQDEEKHDGDCVQRYAGLVEIENTKKTTTVKSATVRGVEILRHLPVPVLQFDIEGTLQYQNPESSKLFGTEEKKSTFSSLFVEESVGQRVSDKVRKGDDDRQEAQLKTMNGPRWFSISVRRRKDPIDSKLVILFSARDITELVQTREEKHQATLKSEFMAVMAHEIRTPLHQVVGTIDLLCLTSLDNRQNELMNITRSSVSLLMAIINDLLDYTKLEGGRVELEKISFEPRGVVKSCVEAVRPKADKKGLVLNNDVSAMIPHKLVGDPNRLRQILLNLLQNAVKFTDRGSVEVMVRPAESTDGVPCRLRFEVLDTGVGIAESEQELIFEKYQQANTTITRKYGGTGLGLAICRALVELMGGNIEVESTLGVGTKFAFEASFETNKVNSRSSFEKLGSDVDVKNLKILVAEDNVVNQKVLAKMLERLGHSCIVSDNGQVAMERLQEIDKVDLVLMDVQMPVVDGVEATKMIRRQKGRGKTELPIVGLTASYQHSDLKYYQDIGMNFCLGKPVRMKQLQEAIRLCQASHGATQQESPEENVSGRNGQ